MKIKFILSIMLCSATIMNVQGQTYNGPYKLAVSSSNGTAVYGYKEVDDERIKEGKFTFKDSSEGYEKINITGFYKDGKKNGHWVSNCSGTGGSAMFGMSRNNRNNFVKPGLTTIIQGDYVDDRRDGKWTYTAKSKEDKYNSTAYFKNGRFFGQFTATLNQTLKTAGDGLLKSNLKGQFAEGGLPDSTWTGKWMKENGIEYMIKMTFNKGKFVSLKAKDLSTGEDISKEFADYTYISGLYNGQGLQVEWGNNLPLVFELLLGVWLWDETLMTNESSITTRICNYLYLDWDRD